MAQNSQRGRRRGPIKDPARQASPNTPVTPDRYQKYLPEWMRGTGAAPVRPVRPRRARPARPAGGYTPGKFASGDAR
jgi:hypothetical protein